MSALPSRPALSVPGPVRRSGLAVTARGLGRDFGGVAVLSGLDLHVPAGQFVAIVGRSGSGKSTLLRILGGLDAPTAGRVAWGEGEADPRRDARMMFQEPRLLPWARVLGNVAVGLGADPGPDAAARARAALADVALLARAGDWPAVLSGGQKQRVALARALVSHPRLLALDEPLGALDALTRIEMQGLIERMWLKERFTAILVTHDVAEAVTLADRVVLIEGGSVGLDLAVPLPRPRARGSAGFGALEAGILARLLEHASEPPAATA